MELFTARWTTRGGWSPALPDADSPATLVLVFGPAETLDDPAPVEQILAAYPRSVVAGCSSAGQILGDSVSDGSLSVAVVRFADSRVVAVTGTVERAEDTHDAAVGLGQRLTAAAAAAGTADDLAAVLVLSDGLSVNGSALAEGLARGIAQGTSHEVPISGGLAGDGGAFERTWVLADGQVRQHAVVAVGLLGPRVRVRHGSQGGWDTFGPVRKVTRAQGNVVYELDGEPILDLYENYLGERAAGLPGTALLFPLCLYGSRVGDPDLVRTVLAVDAEARSMTFAGDVPERSLARLMTSTLDGLVGGAAAAAREACADAPDTGTSDAGTSGGSAAGAGPSGPTLTLAVTCIGRRLVLGHRTEDELEAVLDELPPGAAMIGFYSFGEISPTGGDVSALHNQTMTLTTLGES